MRSRAHGRLANAARLHRTRSTISPTVVRTAKRLADLSGRALDCGSLWNGQAQTSTRPRVQRLDEAMKLAESLGAETQTLTGSDLPAELPHWFSKFENVTQIVIGRSRSRFFSQLLRRSLPHELVRRTQDIAIHVVTRERALPASRIRRVFDGIAPLTVPVRDTRGRRGARCRRAFDQAHAVPEPVRWCSLAGFVHRE